MGQLEKRVQENRENGNGGGEGDRREVIRKIQKGRLK